MRPADILSAVFSRFSGVQLRWAHRLEVYVPCASEHRPLVREQERVSQVHPYNTFWGRLLNDDVRAPVKK